MSLEQKRCPLCGDDNQCGMKTDPQAAGCWCRTAEFGAAIARLPVEAVGEVCICASCARAAELSAHQES